MRSHICAVVVMSIAFGGCGQRRINAPICDEQEGVEPAGVRTLTSRGGRVAWLHAAPHTIAFDRRGDDDCYDVWTITEDGGDESCITCELDGLPKNNVGQPAWHPSGRFLLVQVERDGHEGKRCSIPTTPGIGTHNELWIIDLRTRAATLLRAPVDDGNRGLLHAQFSHDGRRLSWSEMTEGVEATNPGAHFGRWQLMVADVVDDGGPLSLKNIATYVPGERVFYENHGFSPDGSLLIFTSNLYDEEGPLSSDIYTMNLVDGTIAQQLTDFAYNEHAHFSPDGTRVAWMSNRCVVGRGTEEWVMNADGSGARRLTLLNGPDSDVEKVHADVDWNADGSKLIAFITTPGLMPQPPLAEEIVIIDVR